ncbi:MAG: hypothetical protein Q4D29_00130 [Lachnospiraceae bacterium]|nr:hypothetical protein [Lachnospiraceae bacterium]
MSIYSTKKMIIYVVILIIGVGLVAAGTLGYLNSYVSGFGGGLAGVAVVRLVLGMKYRSNEEYAKQVDIVNNDERVIFIAGKAKSWAYYITVLTGALAGSILHAMGHHDYGMICFLFVCVLTVTYWIVYMICDKKY